MSIGIVEWLDSRGFGRFAPQFVEQEIDLDVLFALTEADLRELGLPLGPRRAIALEIAKGRSAPRAPLPASQQQADPASGFALRRRGERRQLTVAFFDMTGSTALAVRLDPEDLRGLLRRFLETVAAAVRSYEGHVARYLGDGVLVLFGWPRAFEDQAERAVCAALDAAKAVRALTYGEDTIVDLRVGIATGRVVVGDDGDDTDNVTGDTPNRAQRLQSIAEPGKIIVDEATRLAVGERFAFDALGPVSAKGFPTPLNVWSVVGEVQASRFDAAHVNLTPFFGRNRELGLLRDRWKIAKKGEGQLVVLMGEAGIGKSRLVKAFQGELAGKVHSIVRLQCVDYQSNSALYPAVQLIRQVAGLMPDDHAETQFHKLERAVLSAFGGCPADVPLMAHLLSISAPSPYEFVGGSGENVRELLINRLIELLLARVSEKPLLAVLEDVHWIDPSTHELLTELAGRIAAERVLLLITARPVWHCPLLQSLNYTELFLNGMPREQSVKIALANGGQSLSNAALDAVLQRAEGVPLYVEELTRAVCSSVTREDVPPTIQGVFVARLDGLGSDKPLVQLLSALGRTFSWSFILAVTGSDEVTLGAALDRLVASGFILRRVSDSESSYRFKHTLIQETAYETLPLRTRRDIHSKVSDVLLTSFASMIEGQPEFAARHLSLAERPMEAVVYWRRAGERFGERSAHKEAISNFRAGLADLSKTQSSPERDALEFDLRIGLGASLVAMEGWSSSGVADNYESAVRLSREAGDLRKLFISLRGQANVYFLNGELVRTRSVIQQLVLIAEQSGDAELLNEAYRSDGMCALHEGNYLRAQMYLERANALYDREKHHHRAFVYGTDPGVVGLSGLSWALWFLGEKDNARKCARNAIALARDVEHPFSLVYAEGFTACLCQFARDAKSSKLHADCVIALAKEHDYPYWTGWGMIVRGWAVAHLYDPARGVAEIEEGIRAYVGTGAKQILPYALALLAEAKLLAGLPAENNERSSDISSASESRFYIPLERLGR
jgi:class 3 adenylate cyclase/tetratricopeptide (TPR) repeat protein